MLLCAGSLAQVALWMVWNKAPTPGALALPLAAFGAHMFLGNWWNGEATAHYHQADVRKSHQLGRCAVPRRCQLVGAREVGATLAISCMNAPCG